MRGNEYVKEYIKISEFSIQSGKVKVSKGYIYVPKSILDSMLSRNNFDTIQGKLRVWKDLHWIDTDKDKYTRKVSINGERVRVVKMEIKVYMTLKTLFGE